MNLTTKFLDALKPSGVRLEYADSVVKGLLLRLSPDGEKTWSLRYRTATGERRRLTLGAYADLSLKDARKMAAAARVRIARGHDPSKAKQIRRAAIGVPKDTIGRLAEDYISRYAKKRKRSWQADDRMLNAEVLPKWRDRLVKDLTRRDVRELLQAIADRGSPYTANLCLAIVRKMLNYAISIDWLDANVASLIQKPGIERSRDRVLTEDEIRRVWIAFDGERHLLLRALLKLRLVTAQRGGELAKIEWEHITGDWLTLPATITKNKQAHRVPLTKTAIAILEQMPRFAGCRWVFPGRTNEHPITTSSHTAPRIIKRVLASDPRITTFDFRAHDLRRTAATYMAEAGIPTMDISRVLNHVEGGPRATQVYNRYGYDREKRIALETWERKLLTILSQTDQGAILPFVSTKAMSSGKTL